MSYSEWLTRRTLQAPKYLDTRPHGDASQFTETVKRQATVVRGRGAASDFVGYNAGAAYSEGTAANTKGPQIEIGPVIPTPPGDYGILTGFDDDHRLYYSNFGITGDFTVELFFKTSNSDSRPQIWRIENANDVGMRISERKMFLRRIPGSDLLMIDGVNANTWYHVAVTRRSGTWYTSVNGVTIERDNAVLNLSDNFLTIGNQDTISPTLAFYNGSISNFRVTESALYTTPTYSIPTPPLSSQGARLLLLATQSNPFGDSAGTNVAEGSCTWQAGPIHPLSTPFPYGMLTGFDLDNRLYYSNFGITGDFTVELFFKIQPEEDERYLWRIENGNDVGMRIIDGNLELRRSTGDEPIIIQSPEANRWYHVAVTREDGTWYTSVNGVTVEIDDQDIDLSNGYLVIGDYDLEGDYPFVNGFISNFRVTESALYTTPTYIIPTPPLSAEGARLLLLATQSNPFGDSAGTNVAAGSCTFQVGSITPLPTFFPYGILSDVELNAGTVTLLQNFTVEFFANLQDSDKTQIVSILKGEKYLNIFQVGLNISVQGITSEFVTIPEDTLYYHYAICGRNGQAALYINGARATPFISYDLDADSDFLIGSEGFEGSLTNFRFTNGQALYGDVYQIPTLPLTGGNLLLLGREYAPPVIDWSDDEFTITGPATFTKDLITVQPPLPFELYGTLTGFSSSSVLTYSSFTLTTYTVELFFKYTTASSTLRVLWEIKKTTTPVASTFVALALRNTSLIVFVNEGEEIKEYTVGTVTSNTWYHVALTRDGQWYVSINGTTTTPTIPENPTLTDAILCIGDVQPSTNPFTSGFISNFRVTSSPLYTTNFTVPSLPLKSIETTEILLLAKTSSTVDVDSSSVERQSSGSCSWQIGPISL